MSYMQDLIDEIINETDERDEYLTPFQIWTDGLDWDDEDLDAQQTDEDQLQLPI